MPAQLEVPRIFISIFTALLALAFCGILIRVGFKKGEEWNAIGKGIMIIFIVILFTSAVGFSGVLPPMENALNRVIDAIFVFE